jgi:hypothetical protein
MLIDCIVPSQLLAKFRAYHVPPKASHEHMGLSVQPNRGLWVCMLLHSCKHLILGWLALPVCDLPVNYVAMYS